MLRLLPCAPAKRSRSKLWIDGSCVALCHAFSVFTFPCALPVDKDDIMPLKFSSIRPQFRGNGIGSSVLQQIMQRTDGKAVCLGCFQKNEQAKRLYLRLGFIQAQETDTHYLFEFGRSQVAPKAKMPPLCKGRWQKSLIFDGGIVKPGNPPVSVHSMSTDSPLCTRGPLDGCAAPYNDLKGVHL